MTGANFEKGSLYSSGTLGLVKFNGLNFASGQASFCFQDMRSGVEHQLSYSELPAHFDGVRVAG